MAFLFPSPEVPAVSRCRRSELSPTIFPSPNPRNLKPLTILKKSGKFFFGARAMACSGIKNSDAMVSDFDQNVSFYGQFSAPVKRGLKQSKEEEEKQNYYVNMGYAIRTLREEFPELFYRELSFDIYSVCPYWIGVFHYTVLYTLYRDDIVFKDPFNTFTGIENYKSIFWALRFHGRIFFRALWVDTISMWQPMENTIMVRWTVHGIPRVPWESHGRFDGTSEYKLDKNGKIFEHRVDNVALNSPPKFRVLAVEDLIQSLGCPSTPKPTYFEVSSMFSERKV